MKGIDVGERVRPSLRVHLPDGVRTVALAAGPDGGLTGSLALAGPLTTATRVDVVDDRGVVLGTTEYTPPAEPTAPPPPPERVHHPQLGPYAPLWQSSPGADVLPFAPTPLNGAAVSVGMVRGGGAWSFQGQVRASGAVGPVGFEAALHTDTTDGKTADGAGWVGVRVRLLRLEGSALEVAPALRVGFPLSASGLPAQVEPAVAVGGVARQFTWLVNFGGRLRTADDGSGTDVPVGQGFILATGTLDVLPWLRVHAALDGHLVMRDGGAKNGVAGLGLGIEGGRAFYGGLSLHLSPWSDQGVGPFTAQLAVGFRGVP